MATPDARALPAATDDSSELPAARKNGSRHEAGFGIAPSMVRRRLLLLSLHRPGSRGLSGLVLNKAVVVPTQ
jgi:hypothetical protein